MALKLSATAAALVVAVGAAAAAPAGERPDRKLTEALMALDGAIKAQNCPRALQLGESLLSKWRGKLPPITETTIDTVVAECALRAGAREKAYAHALHGTGLPQAPDDLWRLRFGLEIDAKKSAAAVETVEAMSRGSATALNRLPTQWLYSLSDSLKRTGRKSERRRLLSILSSDSYVPVESASAPQGLRYSLAELLAEEGETQRAVAVLATVSEPDYLLDALFDTRLAALLPAGFDLRAATEAAVAHERAEAARHPDRLDPVVNAARDLRRLGRPQEALALLAPVLGRPDAARAFIDAGRNLPWAWDEAARSNELLGRFEEAAKAFSAAAGQTEQGALNVSQVINLAYLQVRFGHADQALKTLAAFDDPKRRASPYGYMEMHLVRGCANAALGRSGAARGDLDYAAAHAKDHPQALGALYLCLGRMDEAAAFYIAALEDPERRGVILRTLGDYDPPPAAIPTFFGGKLEALKARPDVNRAIAKAGGIRRIPLQPGDL